MTISHAKLPILLAVLLLSGAVHADPRAFSFNAEGADVKVKPVAELGSLFVLSHRYQGGSDGTDFNLRRDGGQASASFTYRLSAETELFRHHEIILLYQPITEKSAP